MNDKKILKDFMCFLKKEHIYKNYLKNLKVGSKYRLNTAWVRIIDESEWITETIKKCPQRLIIDAFRWDGIETDMWEKLHRKWQDFVLNKSHK